MAEPDNPNNNKNREHKEETDFPGKDLNPYGTPPPIQPTYPPTLPPSEPGRTYTGVRRFHTKKNSLLAAVLSLIIPGLGQFYIGSIYEGLGFLVAWAVGWFLFFFGAFINNGFIVIGGMIITFIFTISAAAFAYQRSQEYNNSIITTGEPPKWAVTY